jgi:hypothetical protein
LIQVAQLSEWLELMLAEVARKREDLERAREEQAARVREQRGAEPSAEADSRGPQLP